MAFNDWLYAFRLKTRTQQINWMKSYALKKKKENKHLTEEQFVCVFGSRMAEFMDGEMGKEATHIAVMVAKECYDGKYEVSKEYKKPGTLANLKFNALKPREPYTAPTYTKNDGEVHSMELEAE